MRTLCNAPSQGTGTALSELFDLESSQITSTWKKIVGNGFSFSFLFLKLKANSFACSRILRTFAFCLISASTTAFKAYPHSFLHVSLALAMDQPLLGEETLNSPTVAEDPPETPNSWTLVEMIPALLQHLEEGFQDTRVLEAQPNFFEEVLKVPRQIILTHSCVVLGPAGAGKTTLVKALAGDEFQPTVAPGPHMDNRSMEAQSCTLQLENLIESENLEVVLIDTPGWSPDTSTNIKSEYKKILKKRGLVSEHTPHIILFCIPVSMIRQFQDAEAKKMSKQLHELKFDQRFPITVLPVATKADCEHHRDRGKLLFAIKKLAEKAFAGTGADVEDPIYTMFPPEGQAHGMDEVKECLSAMLSQQINSPEFGGLWQKAFAKSLATHTMRHCEQFPENDSAIRLFQRASRTVAATCGRSVPDVTETTSQDALHLPWENLLKVAKTQEEACVPTTAQFQAVWLNLCVTCL